MNYKIANRLTGAVAFLIAAVTYILTAEPTTSLWDCGEFITTSVGLQVGHPPGAPLFMIISRLFAIFAPSPDKQALMINYMSGMCSAATVLFLCWTITFFAKRLLVKRGEEPVGAKKWAILLSGFVGSVAYAFTDTFWFSAVEGEVYAMSSLFTAVVFWAILKWDECADEPHSNRWLVFIMFLMGLSVGVHLLNLLAIPAIVFLYYFRKYPVSRKGIIWASVAAVVILGFVNFILIPYVIKIACWFELAFVNGMGLPFNTGVVIYVLAIAAGLFYGIRYSVQKCKPMLNLALTCLMVFFIGYSSYAMVVIRSVSNPPIDENSPDNVFDLLAYINREQYGDSPLIYGQYYNAPLVETKQGDPIYFQDKERGMYVLVDHKQEYVYDKRFCTLFPRMHSSTRSYFPSLYESWGGKPSGKTYNVDGRRVTAPSMKNNLQYFFSYQLNHMYWRYVMWNFAGRQNDEQGYGDVADGNWISGIKFLDEIRLGDQDYLPDRTKESPAHNKYYLLPFLLGLVGLVYQYCKGKQGKQDFSIVMILFFMTGIAIILFLNQSPLEPRERDYAYAGSFYAFAIWIGLGVTALYDWIGKKLKASDKVWVPVAVGTLCFVAVPLNLAAENWDDHDRSGRYATLAYATDYLESCAPNAILFTYGDNDTFPLWYAQEVEGIRRDVRIVNLSLLSGDWYIDQMKRKAYETPGVPISFADNQYHGGKRDIVLVAPGQNQNNGTVSLANALLCVKDDRNKVGDYNYIPSKKLSLPVNKQAVVANGLVNPNMADSLVDNLEFTLGGNYLTKSQLMVLDILNTNNWERPIYFGIGMGEDNYMGLQKYFQLDGAAYRLVPIETKVESGALGRIDTEVLYDNLMNKYKWGNINNPDVYIDHFHRSTISVMDFRNTFMRLALALYDEGDIERAVKVLDKAMEELPLSQVPFEAYSPLLNYVAMYYEFGEQEKADKLALDILDDQLQLFRYTTVLTESGRADATINRNSRLATENVKYIIDLMKMFGREEMANQKLMEYSNF